MVENYLTVLAWIFGGLCFFLLIGKLIFTFTYEESSLYIEDLIKGRTRKVSVVVEIVIIILAASWLLIK